MNAASFIDTNVLVYAYDRQAPEKRQIAKEIVRNSWLNPGQSAISVQVLQEFYVNLIRKGVALNEAAELVRDYLVWPVVESSIPLLERALVDQSRWRISFWDALIVAAARCSGAKVLYSEDLNNGQDFDGVRVVNPFAPTA